MRTILTTLLVVALFVVMVLDGIGMFMAYQSSQDAAITAAQQAAIQYVSSGSVSAAEEAANSYASQKNVQLVRLDLHRADKNWFEAETRVEADTYLMKYLPVLKDFTAQEATAVVRF